MEKWKDIPGYENLYQASNFGQIRTCEGKVTKSARSEHRVWKQRILKQKWQKRHNSNKKDARVTVWKDGKEETKLVSRLVAMTWCNGYNEKLTVNHIDGDPSNNKAENLEWVSYAENIQKGFATGLFGTQKQVKLLRDGKTMTFQSMSEASRFLHHNNGYISTCIKRNRTIVNGYVIAYGL